MSIDSRTDFSFPYDKPYDIQLNFMRSLYKCLDNKKIGIFESPTGTGKSLSIICGSLSWLHDYKQSQANKLKELIDQQDKDKKDKIIKNSYDHDHLIFYEILLRNSKKENINNDNDNTFDDWLKEHEQTFEKKESNKLLKDKLKKQIDQEIKFKESKEKAKQKLKLSKTKCEQRVNILQKTTLNVNTKRVECTTHDGYNDDNKLKDDLDIIIDDYLSDDDDDYDNYNHNDENKHVYEDNREEINEDFSTKIFYCSRTHSQLSQFIGELRKTKFANTIRLVTLGSRMNLCINDRVLKLNSVQLINEKCIELQKSTKKNTISSSCGSKKFKLDTSINNNNNNNNNNQTCTYFKSLQVNEFNLEIIKDVYDIEDVVKIGQETRMCPYYGTRHSIKSAELIALPYNILFQKETRQSYGINLKNQVIIIDEAHNLLDTITQIHSIEITSVHVSQARVQVNAYFDKYKTRLSAKNILYLRQLLNVLNALNNCFLLKENDNNKNLLSAKDGKLAIKHSKIWSLNEFFAETKFYNMNFIKLLRFCDETKLEKKLIGFHEKYMPQVKQDECVSDDNGSVKIVLMKSPLMQIKAFLKVLSSTKLDGRILLNIDTSSSLSSLSSSSSSSSSSSKSTLKFILMNPHKCFQELLDDCHSIVLAGGTMKPISDFELLIKGNVDYDFNQHKTIRTIEYFSCDHVIPKENIYAFALATSITGHRFDFSYASRDNNQMLNELGNELIHLCACVPAGMIVFFVSYDYMNKVLSQFKKANNNYILTKIQEKKRIFYEPKTSIECERVFESYTNVIKKEHKGALLFAVVGGKMSEGINFSDDLGRCVIVVGQPYANIKSLELQEKMQYLNKTQLTQQREQQQQSTSSLSSSSSIDVINVKQVNAGQLYYENLCWKSINQTIGRAIRHQNDYASIILIDSRYCTMSDFSLNDKLPKWILQAFKRESKEYSSKCLHEKLSEFYKTKSK